MLVVDPKGYAQIISDVNLSRLRNRSIFITGGTGFFGLWLLNLFRILNEDGYNIEVTLLSRDPQKFLANNAAYANINWLHWIKGDVTNYPITDQKFDLFIHGAANTKPVSPDKQLEVFESIVSGTMHVFKHAVSANVKRVLLISSGAVYGEVPPGTDLITEDITTAPVTNKIENAYGEAKRASELLGYCFAAESGIEVVTARCFAFTGFGIGDHLVLSQFMNQAINNDEIVIKGSGNARRSFLHGRDLAVWLLKLLADGTSGEIYNVGSDDAYTITQLAELVRNEIAPGKNVNVLGSQKLEQRMNYIPSVEKAKTLGLNVWTTLIDAIKELK